MPRNKYTTLHYAGKKLLEEKHHPTFEDASEHARGIAEFHKAAYDNTDVDHGQGIGSNREDYDLMAKIKGKMKDVESVHVMPRDEAEIHKNFAFKPKK